MNLRSRETGCTDGDDIGAAPFHTPRASVINIFFFSTWVAVCSAAPELIWQGFLTVIHHFSWITVWSAVLVGSIVAFFVEPLTERLRNLSLQLSHRHRTATHATLSAFAFAVLAVLVHEAITSYVLAAKTSEHASDSLFSAISVVFQWACIPFTTTIAWFCAYGRWWIGLFALLLALLAIALVGVVFEWDIQDILTTAIPCTCILLVGFVHMRKHLDQQVLSRCAMLTAAIALIWLVSAGLLQLILSLFAPKGMYVYTRIEYVIDVRFYLGWIIGLAVAPRPAVSHAAGA